ncbi:hypothetical protein [Streptomyces sp. NPDC058861]|uniref:hypothetical protein n=1 Tax=Streptomyces sp. NPDC058861 TaxID=3346653 RepID=UPI0036803193
MPERLYSEKFRLLRELDLPSGDLVIAGSAPLFIRGLRDRMSDLDVVARGEALRRALLLGEARPAPFDSAVSIRLMGGRLEIADAWFTSLFGDVEELFERAETIGGLRFLTLSDTEAWKRRLDRPKDRIDLVRMAESVRESRSPRVRGGPACTKQTTSSASGREPHRRVRIAPRIGHRSLRTWRADKA